MKKYKYRKTFTFEGKRYEVYGHSERECYEKMALKKRDLEEGRVVLNKTTTVSQWAKICLDTYKHDVSDKTRYNLDCTLKNHVFPYIGNMPLGSVKAVHCQNILNNLTGMSKDTIIKTSQLLNLIFKTARENQLILIEPTIGVIRPDGKVSHHRAITETERRYLLQVCDADDSLIPFLFMLYCGCRPKEALNIRANDMQTVEDVRVLHIRGTKTAKADRSVPIPLEFLDKIDRLSPGGFELFSVRRNGEPHNDNSYRALVKSLRRQMNIAMGARLYRNQLVPPLPLADDFTPYCLRHTYCTDLKKAGVPLAIAKDYMGHADITTTANIYSHSDDDTLLKGAAILGIKKSG